MLCLKKGFTLIELLTVLGIVSILAAVAYPQYQKYIRKGRQLEAKANLGVVYQKQLTYLSSEIKLSPSLKTIGAVPKGRIRYNIGTDWDGASTDDEKETIFTRGTAADDLCPCHNDQRGKNVPTNMDCWADPNPEGTQACGSTEICYGHEAGHNGSKMTQQLSVSGVPSSDNNIPTSPAGFKIDGGKFEYYAVGCTSPQLKSAVNLDIWSINHKKNLRNIKAGL